MATPSEHVGKLAAFLAILAARTQGFSPNVYVDVAPVLDKKKQALFAHVIENGEDTWRQHRETMATFAVGRAAFRPPRLSCSFLAARRPAIFAACEARLWLRSVLSHSTGRRLFIVLNALE